MSANESNPGEDDDGVLERDTIEDKYVRYGEQIGKGRFKVVYRGFDEKLGRDVAWAKIDGTANHLTEQELDQVLQEVQDGQQLSHTNVINYYLAWTDHENKCVNFITELFTSGNLRDYRMKHKHLGVKAIKKWAKQLLDGLHYLHTQADGPLVHGDLRCDKIYINGHTGGIKIGDLGLATLLERRYNEKSQSGDYSMLVQQSKTQADVYCFGLCILELLTLRPLDPTSSAGWEIILENEVDDPDAKLFIKRCLMPDGRTPSAEDLLKDKFLVDDRTSFLGRQRSSNASSHDSSRQELAAEENAIASELKSALGSIRGDEWKFDVKGVRRSSGWLTLKLNMTPTEELTENPAAKEAGTILPESTFALQFDYDPDTDDPQQVVTELADALPDMGRQELSSIDQDMCISAIKECVNSLLD